LPSKVFRYSSNTINRNKLSVASLSNLIEELDKMVIKINKSISLKNQDHVYSPSSSGFSNALRTFKHNQSSNLDHDSSNSNHFISKNTKHDQLGEVVDMRSNKGFNSKKSDRSPSKDSFSAPKDQKPIAPYIGIQSHYNEIKSSGTISDVNILSFNYSDSLNNKTNLDSNNKSLGIYEKNSHFLDEKTLITLTNGKYEKSAHGKLMDLYLEDLSFLINDINGNKKYEKKSKEEKDNNNNNNENNTINTVNNNIDDSKNRPTSYDNSNSSPVNQSHSSSSLSSSLISEISFSINCLPSAPNESVVQQDSSSKDSTKQERPKTSLDLNPNLYVYKPDPEIFKIYC